MQQVGLRIETDIFNVNKNIGEKTNGLGNHKEKQKNERNNLKWTCILIRSNKFLNINNIQIRNGTRKGTRTCPHGTKNIKISPDSLSSISSDDSSEKALDDSSNSGTRQKPNKHLTYYIEENP